MRLTVFAATALFLSAWSAHADYLYIKIDLSQVYLNPPTTPNAGGTGAIGIQPPPKIGVPAVPGMPGEGPFAHAVIEIKKRHGDVNGGDKKDGWAMVVDHPWSKPGLSARILHMPNLTPSVIKITYIKRETPAKEFEKLFKKDPAIFKDSAKLLDAASWALSRGLSKEFHAALGEYVKLNPKSPIAENYNRVVNGLKKPPLGEDPLLKNLIADLKSANYAIVGSDGRFYYAYSNLGLESNAMIVSRMARMHETMENFYYWFVLRPEVAQPELPKYKLPVLVTKTMDEFYSKHSEWDSPPLVGNTFTAPRDNIVVMAGPRANEILAAFTAGNQHLLQAAGFSKDFFLAGSVWDTKPPPKQSPAPQPPQPGTGQPQPDTFFLAYVETLILAQKAMEEEDDRSGISFPAVRQLLVASGILPRRVHIPEWIASGLAGIFETPAGAPYPGVGSPNWKQLITFKHLRTIRRLEKPGETLRGIVADGHFRDARKHLSELADSLDRDKLAEQVNVEMEVARAASWAFAYYFVERKRSPQILINYCRELASLPRDLDLDSRALEACFAKSFGVADATNPGRVDPVKLNALADAWFADMAGVALDIPELQTEYLELRAGAKSRKEK